MNDIKNKRTINQPEFIKLLADRAGFTQADTKDMFDALVAIFEDSARFGIELKIRGLGKLHFVELDEREVSGYTTKDGEEIPPATYPPTTKTIFTLSENIRFAKRRDS